jgi:hypothetical protein
VSTDNHLCQSILILSLDPAPFFKGKMKNQYFSIELQDKQEKDGDRITQREEQDKNI